MRFAGRTHAGRRGGQNEDAIGWSEAERLWLVADGMGGHASGDVASRIVRETLLGAALKLPLDEALSRAHEAVLAIAGSNPAHAGMGATAVVARMAGQQADIAWVGDSRAYLWRARSLTQLTRDHSFLEELRTQEGLSEAQLRNHPHRNLVTRTLGRGTPTASRITQPLRRGDRLLLCSDGLNDELEDREIAAVLRAHATVEAAADALIAAALARGGRDNVSVVVVEYDGPDGVSLLRRLARAMGLGLPIIAGVLAAVLAALLWEWLHGR